MGIAVTKIFFTRTCRSIQIWTIFLLAGCGLAFSENVVLEGNNFSETIALDVESASGLTLPNNTKRLNYAYIGQNVDPTFLAKFELAEDGAGNVGAQLRRKDIKKAIIQSSITNKYKWWNPTSGKIVAESTYFGKGGCTHVYVCRFDDRYFLYIHCFKL